MVTIKYRSGLADTLGKTEELINVNKVSDVLKYIRRNYGKEAYTTAKSMVIAVNEISILKLRIFRTELNDGDTVQFLPISGGG